MTKFIAYRNEGGGDFVAWAEANPAACLRRYQVRDTGADQPGDISNTDQEERVATFEVLVAYPQSSRFGGGAALDRDEAIRSDQQQIEAAIGMYGGGNFIPPNPNACWLSGSVTRRIGRGVDFLVITQTMAIIVALETAVAVDTVTNLPTTTRALRDHARDLVLGVAPSLLAGTPFIAYRNEGDGDFRTWSEANPPAALRRFQIRDTGTFSAPSMQNTDLETRQVVLELLVAYPQTQRYGGAAALARDDVMKADQILLERSVAVYSMWTGAGAPNATVLGLAVARELGTSVDFLALTLTLSYRRTVGA